MHLRIAWYGVVSHLVITLSGAQPTESSPSKSIALTVPGLRTPDSGQGTSPDVIWGGGRSSYPSYEYLEADIENLTRLVEHEKRIQKNVNPLIERRLRELLEKKRNAQTAEAEKVQTMFSFYALNISEKYTQGGCDGTEY